jgi:DNA-binding GntR family transcriptional regulator
MAVADTKLSLREQAYRELKGRILGAKLKLGEVLSPRKIGEELGMSFLPVSEALRLLEAEGLVESKDRVGTRVKVPTVEDIEGLCMVREALESQAARLAATKATSTERKKLLSMARQVDKKYAGAKLSEKQRSEAGLYHAAFHRYVTECSHCKALLQATESTNVYALKILFEGVLKQKVRPSNFHEIYAEAIVSGSPETADKAAREHLAYGVREWFFLAAEFEPQNRWRH